MLSFKYCFYIVSNMGWTVSSAWAGGSGTVCK